MRVFVVEPDGAGGLLHYAFQLASGLDECGHQVTLVTGRDYELAPVPTPFRVEPRMRLWPVVETGGRLPSPLRKARRAWRGLKYLVAWHRLTRHLLAERPELTIFSTVRFPVQSVFLRRLHRAGIRMGQICHEFEPREARIGWVRRLSRGAAAAAYRCFEVIFFHGEAHRARFLELFTTPADLVIIPHGNEGLLARMADAGGDRRSHYGLGPDTTVALFFGGLRPSKGLPELVTAFATVAPEVPGAALIIAGHPAAGFDPASLRSLAAQLGVDGSVQIDDRYLDLSEVGPLLRTATVVALPYRSGTASGVLQAAYAFDRPVVVTDVGSLAEAVEHGITGLVVPPDDPDALAAALVKMLGQPGEAADMGLAAGRISRERFGWRPIAEAVVAAHGRRR